ncbi:MAG: ResB protein required for cytochrome C biosynthesis, partial [Nitrospiraceae bacterium]|nr:ResB protein required for cytochrome C biosynthesis [Nitrospiraceae bacterium]
MLFLLLLLLTYLGTLHQTEYGLFESQQTYFNSIFLIHRAFGTIPVPLPGGYLLVTLLFINLVCGGIIRVRKGWSKLGILVTHVGICVLLVGSFITFEFSESGHMTL